MSVRIQLVAIVAQFIVLAAILSLARQRKLKESYSILWFVAAGGMMVLTIWKELLFAFSQWLGIYNANAAVFFFSLVFVLLYLVHLSVQTTKLADQNKEFCHSIGLLQLEIENLQREVKP